MNNPFYPAGVTESDIDNIGEPLCADAQTVIEYRFGDDSIRIDVKGDTWIGIKANAIRIVVRHIEREFGELDQYKVDILVTNILDAVEYKYTRTEKEEGLTL